MQTDAKQAPILEEEANLEILCRYCSIPIEGIDEASKTVGRVLFEESSETIEESEG
jgi:hypothetical protein